MGYKHKGNSNPNWFDIPLAIGTRNYYLYVNRNGRWCVMHRQSEHNFSSLGETAATFRLAFRLAQEDWRKWKQENDLLRDTQATATERGRMEALVTMEVRLAARRRLIDRMESESYIDHSTPGRECPIETYHQAVVMTKGMRI